MQGSIDKYQLENKYWNKPDSFYYNNYNKIYYNKMPSLENLTEGINWITGGPQD